MKIGNVLGSMVGACAVYLAMVACSSSEHPAASSVASGSGGSSARAVASSSDVGAGGAQGAGGAGHDGGIFDALTDPTPDANADPVSGSRLKAYHITGDDGSKGYDSLRWYDSAIDTDCFFDASEDGMLRCLPVGLDPGQRYSDPGCLNEIITIPSLCSPPKYIRRVNNMPCIYGSDYGPYMYKIIKVGAQVPTLSTLYYGSSGSCVATVLNVTDNWYSVGAAMPASSFVAGTKSHD